MDISLDRDTLITAGFALLAQGGLDGLSMRRLAERLGVQAPALYWHIGDKAELLGLMARDIYRLAHADLPPASDWRAWLLAYGHSLKRVFATHRDSARLCATARPPIAANVQTHAQAIAAPLVVLGLAPALSLKYQAAVIAFALGWASFEANGPMHDFLDDMLGFDDSFAMGLNALIAGFGQGPAAA